MAPSQDRVSISTCSLRQPLRGSSLRYDPYGVTSAVRADILKMSARRNVAKTRPPPAGLSKE